MPAQYPISWYQVAWSSELKPKSIKSVKLCGRSLVAYRGEDNKAYVLDAHCPHLGAHLGVNGKVCGTQIRCAFHGWQFGGDGQCQKLPSDSKITSKMHTRSWRVVERYGIVFVHYDPEFTKPNEPFTPVTMLEAGSFGTPIGKAHAISTRQSDVLENGVDMEHFTSVHGVPMNNARLTSSPEGNLIFHHQTITKRLGIRFDTMMQIIYLNPGLQVIHLHNVLGRECIALSSVSPIDENSVTAHLTVHVQEGRVPALTAFLGRILSYCINSTFAEDIPIWNQKIFREHPVLAKGDEGIPKFRNWYRTFPVAP